MVVCVCLHNILMVRPSWGVVDVIGCVGVEGTGFSMAAHSQAMFTVVAGELVSAVQCSGLSVMVVNATS